MIDELSQGKVPAAIQDAYDQGLITKEEYDVIVNEAEQISENKNDPSGDVTIQASSFTVYATSTYWDDCPGYGNSGEWSSYSYNGAGSHKVKINKAGWDALRYATTVGASNFVAKMYEKALISAGLRYITLAAGVTLSATAVGIIVGVAVGEFIVYAFSSVDGGDSYADISWNDTAAINVYNEKYGSFYNDEYGYKSARDNGIYPSCP